MAQEQKKTKKPYTPPKVRVWGSVADLTNTPAGDQTGGSNGGGVPG